MAERVLTLHPEGKAGVNIERAKYDAIQSAIIEALGVDADVAFQDLLEIVENALRERFEGSVGWYVTTVKLDLEARGVIERVPGVRPQRLRLSA